VTSCATVCARWVRQQPPSGWICGAVVVVACGWSWGLPSPVVVLEHNRTGGCVVLGHNAPILVKARIFPPPAGLIARGAHHDAIMGKLGVIGATDKTAGTPGIGHRVIVGHHSTPPSLSHARTIRTKTHTAITFSPRRVGRIPLTGSPCGPGACGYSQEPRHQGRHPPLGVAGCAIGDR